MPNDELWRDAASFAAVAHRHQVRKDGVTPYVAHVFRVAMIVRDLFGCDDPVCLAAALLHDVIEDTGADYDELEERFGGEVADCVAALTKNMALPEKDREAEYDARLAAADWRARLVKLADQYDNLWDVCGGDEAFCKRARKRAERALKLAEPDANNEHIRRGIKAVREALARSRQS